MKYVDTIILGPGPIRAADVVAVARHGAPVELSPGAETEITASRKVIEALAEDVQPHYGVSTGFGALATRHIPVDRRDSCSAA
jgi:histidine ammonia-lyase